MAEVSVEVKTDEQRCTSYSFGKIAKQEAREGSEEDVKRLLEKCPLDRKEEFAKNLNGFQKMFQRFLDEEEKEIKWNSISLPPPEMIEAYDAFQSEELWEARQLLDKLVVVKLNGGLGTSMGCTYPKSVITVRDEKTFLDLQVQHIENLNNRYGCRIPLVLMNSFNTHEDTKKVIRKYMHLNVPLHCFQQSQYPRLFKESLRCVPTSIGDSETGSWYPPGHGDMYQAFYNSGLMEKFIAEGKEYIFVSNIDNLGATVDLSILNHLLSQSDDAKFEFVMEVTDKTKADVKGGTLIKCKDKLRLLELAQVPKGHIEDFKSIKKFKIFNTNNLWVRLSAMQRLIKSDSLHMEIIVNQKQLPNGDKIIQLESAIGDAIKCFNRSIGINVPRSRFLPVKTCSDLFLIMSNLYTMTSNGTLAMTTQREFAVTPYVLLGNHFKNVAEFLARFANIPDVLELDHLTVAGDVTFGKNVVLKGTVIVLANHGESIDIPSGSVLENKIVSGNLRIMSH